MKQSTLSWETVDSIVADGLKSSYESLNEDIIRLREKFNDKTILQYEEQDLEENVKYQRAFKIVLEYYGVNDV
jgi:hypothetical protein